MSPVSTTALVLGVIAASGPQLVNAWRSEGRLPSAATYTEYVGKFAFDFEPCSKVTLSGGRTIIDKSKCISGFFNITVGQDENANDFHSGNLYALAFDDRHWQAAQGSWDDSDCEALAKKASWSQHISPILDSQAQHWHTTKVQIHQIVLPRFWYFVFANCGTKPIAPLVYSIHAYNLHQSFPEFSFEVNESLPLQVVFAILFALVMLASCVLMIDTESKKGCSAAASTELESFTITTLPSQGCSDASMAGDGTVGEDSCRVRGEKKGYMQLLRLLSVSAICSSIGCCFSTSYLVQLAITGRATLFFQLFGTLFAGLGKAWLMILIILISKGAAFSVGKLKGIREYPVILAALLTAIGLSVACEIHELCYHDPWSSYDLYETIPGKITLSINLGLLAAVWCLVWKAYRGDAVVEARFFYRGVLLASFVQLLSQSVTLVLAQLLARFLVRKIIERIDLATHFVVTVILLRCLQPARLDAIVAARSELLCDATDYDGSPSHAQGMVGDMQELMEFVKRESDPTERPHDYCPPAAAV